MRTTLFARPERVPASRPSSGRRFLQDRRRFLETGLGAVGAFAVAQGGITWIVGPNRAWAVELGSIDATVADGLMQMTRALYPHDFLGDAAYAKVVQALDADAAADEGAVLKAGIESLEEAAGGAFADLDEAGREDALRKIAGTPFFEAVRGKTVAVLYNQPEVWAEFGYEGPSYEKGGYLFSGFDDLSWLPAPPEEASPAVKT